MNSYLTEEFIELFQRLPDSVKQQARKQYHIWQRNPRHPDLQFKRIHGREPIYSVRIGRGWRALGLLEGDAVTWFWIGSHADYDELLARL